MAATDPTITLAAVMEWQAPDGTVRLADGGVVKFDPGTGLVTFTGDDPVFGTIVAFDEFDTAIGDSVDGGAFTFAPPASATLTDWWREDLENTRLRLWLGEIDPADKVTLTGAELVADWLVDTAGREQGEASDLLTIDCITNLERLFQIRQGNVVSDAFLQTIYPGDRAFENCTDNQRFFAWGTESPPASGSAGGAGGGGGGGGGGSLRDAFL